MNLTIDLNGEAESRLKTAAGRHGVKPEVYAKQILEQYLPATDQPAIEQATLDLLTQWDDEDETTDAGEISRRQNELRDFQNAMNKNRLQSDGLNSRKLYP